MNRIRNEISIKAMNQARQLEAEEIRNHFISCGCKIKLYPFLDRWYAHFQKYKKDTVENVWQRFSENRMNKLNGLDNINEHRVRIFFEKPEER